MLQTNYDFDTVPKEELKRLWNEVFSYSDVLEVWALADDYTNLTEQQIFFVLCKDKKLCSDIADFMCDLYNDPVTGWSGNVCFGPSGLLKPNEYLELLRRRYPRLHQIYKVGESIYAE